MLRTLRNLAPLLFLAASLHGVGGPLDDKGPPYFVDRYGGGDAAVTEAKYSFIHRGRGSVAIKGPFSVRRFRQGKLRVEAVFHSPSLKLAGVTLRMNQAWSGEQIQAALQAYGGQWQPVERNGVVRDWIAPDGTTALVMINSLRFQSKAVVDAVAQELAEQDAKRKAVPTF